MRGEGEEKNREKGIKKRLVSPPFRGVQEQFGWGRSTSSYLSNQSRRSKKARWEEQNISVCDKNSSQLSCLLRGHWLLDQNSAAQRLTAGTRQQPAGAKITQESTPRYKLLKDESILKKESYSS